MSLQWFRQCARLVLVAFVLLVGGLGTDLVTVDRVETQELDAEVIVAAPPALDLSSPFAHTDLDPPLAAVAPAAAAPLLLPARRSPAPDAGPPRYPIRSHPPPRV